MLIGSRQGTINISKQIDNPYKWSPDTVSDILEKREYIGDTVNFKTHKQSYKSKKKINNPKEQHMIFEDTYEPIIDVDTWEKVQELRKNKRRPTRTGKTNMFSALSIVLIAVKSYITVQERILKKDKITLFVQLQGKRVKTFAILTISARLFLRKVS